MLGGVGGELGRWLMLVLGGVGGELGRWLMLVLGGVGGEVGSGTRLCAIDLVERGGGGRTF